MRTHSEQNKVEIHCIHAKIARLQCSFMYQKRNNSTEIFLGELIFHYVVRQQFLIKMSAYVNNIMYSNRVHSYYTCRFIPSVYNTQNLKHAFYIQQCAHTLKFNVVFEFFWRRQYYFEKTK